MVSNPPLFFHVTCFLHFFILLGLLLFFSRIHCYKPRDLVDANQLNVEQQSGVGWDQTWEASWAVSLVTWDSQVSSGANAQLRDTGVPALDNLTDTNGALEWLTSVARGVELLAVLQSTGVVDGNQVTDLWEGLTVAFLQDFNLGSRWSRHDVSYCTMCEYRFGDRVSNCAKHSAMRWHPVLFR